MTFVDYKTADNAQSTLLGSISSSATSLQVASGAGAIFPATGEYFLTLEEVSLNEFETETVTKKEQVKVTSRSSDTFTIVRAQNGTTAVPFSEDDRVSLYLVSKNMEEINAEAVRLETEKLNTDGQLRTGNGARKQAYTNGDGDEVELALGSAGEVMMSNGPAAAPTFGTPTISAATIKTQYESNADTNAFTDAEKAKLAIAIGEPKVGADHAIEANTERSSNSTSYVLVKQITIDRAGDYRASYDLNKSSGHDAYGDIRKNSVSVTETVISFGYTTYTEDFTGLEVGDEIAIYYRQTNPVQTVFVRNFQLQFGIIDPSDFGTVDTD